jgi:hypothetical protein
MRSLKYGEKAKPVLWHSYSKHRDMLAKLAAKREINRSEVVRTAIEKLYAREFPKS